MAGFQVTLRGRIRVTAEGLSARCVACIGTGKCDYCDGTGHAVKKSLLEWLGELIRGTGGKRVG
jgi:hypothetical protein